MRKGTINFETFNNIILVYSNIVLDVLYNVVCSVRVVYSVFCSVFISVQIQCLMTTSSNFLQRMLDFFIIATTISAKFNGPFSQSRSHIIVISY